jgi:hypothetical protein
MKFTLLLLSGITASFASIEKVKRATCTVQSLNDPLKDDVPAITEALQQCGNGGKVLFPVNQTFHIRSPIDLSSCRICNLQIDGLLSVSPEWGYWEKQTAVFQLSKTSNAIIYSHGATGIIDANNFGSGSNPPARVPDLFSISRGSYQVHIRDLQVRNAPGTAFHVSNSSAIRFYTVNIQGPVGTGYLVDQTQHVYVWNNTIRATRSCVLITPNSSNVQVEESTCIATGTHDAHSGFEFRFGAGTGLDWIRNVFVRKIKTVGNMNVVSFLAGSGAGKPHPVEIDNTTFMDITLQGPAKKAVNVEEGLNTLNATDVAFRAFVGEAQKESDLRCASPEDFCEFEAENWNVAIRN